VNGITDFLNWAVETISASAHEINLRNTGH
jgi:hypothetical protein